MSRASIYNPYWDTLGGGERYVATVASILAKNGYSVDIEWHDKEIIETLQKRFNLDLKKVKIVQSIERGRGYDVCFWVSDGSIPLLYSRKNLLHCQVPFVFKDQVNLMNKMKLFRVNQTICNSYFTKKYIDQSFGINSAVIHPPIDTKQFKSKKKENVILYVGRFSKLTQSKRQDILIQSFKKFFDKNNQNWKLVLAGGVEVGVGSFLKELKNMAEGYPVRFVESPSFKELQELYGKAKFFWSAAGFGEDQEKYPQRMEHFGMSVVESMCTGAIPVVFNGGGFPEIVESHTNGFLWNHPDELVAITQELVDDKKELATMSKLAQKSTKQYDIKEFEEKFLALL